MFGLKEFWQRRRTSQEDISEPNENITVSLEPDEEHALARHVIEAFLEEDSDNNIVEIPLPEDADIDESGLRSAIALVAKELVAKDCGHERPLLLRITEEGVAILQRRTLRTQTVR